MLKRTFISLSFSEKFLQVLQLDSSKKKVKKYTAIGLPEGLIISYKVTDRRVLAEIIKTLWKKLGLKEKTVGIVVPEFSTYIKNLKLPKMEIAELDEAVRWQSHDFLPKPVGEMSMDWRITKELKDGYIILAVAMEKEVLRGYVDAVDFAGLFPLVVETPSLSLIRATSASLAGRLIIYNYFDEVILIVAEGMKILGSSVVASKDANEIIKTAGKIVTHYKETKIEKVLIGGVAFDPSLLKGLQETLQLPLNKISLNITGLSEEDIQKYLIPVSLQFIKPTPPADEETINLLPQAVVKEYEHKRLGIKLWTMMMIVTFVVWSSFFISIGTYLFLNQQIATFKKDGKAQLNIFSETQQARAQIKQINEVADKVIKIMEVSKLPQEILNPVNAAKPVGVTLTGYRLDLERGNVVLQGNALTRNDLVTFKQVLEGDEDISQVTIPISSFEVESNLDFKLSFIYQPIAKLK